MLNLNECQNLLGGEWTWTEDETGGCPRVLAEQTGRRGVARRVQWVEDAPGRIRCMAEVIAAPAVITDPPLVVGMAASDGTWPTATAAWESCQRAASAVRIPPPDAVEALSRMSDREPDSLAVPCASGWRAEWLPGVHRESRARLLAPVEAWRVIGHNTVRRED